MPKPSKKAPINGGLQQNLSAGQPRGRAGNNSKGKQMVRDNVPRSVSDLVAPVRVCFRNLAVAANTGANSFSWIVPIAIATTITGAMTPGSSTYTFPVAFCPQLNTFSSIYANSRPIGFSLKYVGRVGDTPAGTMAMAVDPDPRGNGLSLTLQSTMMNDGAVSCDIKDEAILRWRPRTDEDKRLKYNAVSSVGTPLRGEESYSSGRVLIFSSNDQLSAVQLGIFESETWWEFANSHVS